MIELDEARERFDRRLGERIEQAGGRLAAQAVDAAAVDSAGSFVHLPAVSR